MQYTVNHEPGLTQMPTMLYGRVLVLGLGRGVGIKKLLCFASIHRLVAIDNDPEVIAAYNVPDERVQVVEADAATYYRDNQGFFDFICQDLPNPLPGGQWLKVPQGVSWVSV